MGLSERERGVSHSRLSVLVDRCISASPAHLIAPHTPTLRNTGRNVNVQRTIPSANSSLCVPSKARTPAANLTPRDLAH